MSATLQEIENRLAALEAEMATLRQLVMPPTDEMPAQRVARLLAQARRDQPLVRAAWAKSMEKMGIRVGEPVPPETLREMMTECGVKPEENLFSRGIIEMREE